MAIGISKPSIRRRKLSDLPDDCVGWLEPGVELEGNIKVASGLIGLNAHVKGDIVSGGLVVVREQGEVEGCIQSRNVSITGKVMGDVHAEERLEIKEHGIVLGDIYTPCLLVDPGAYFEGQCHMPLEASSPAKAGVATQTPPPAPPAKAEVAVQIPPPAPPERIVEAPIARPQPSMPVGGVLFSEAPESAESAVPEPPQLPVVRESSGRVKYLGLGLGLLAGIAVGIWYFSRPAVKPPTQAASPSSGPSGRENPNDGLKYVWIPGGSFQMGCSPQDAECRDDENPPHRVTIAKGFWLGQTEVTVGAYKRFAAAIRKAMPAAPNFNPGWSTEQMPMVKILWDDAQGFCTWAGGRLPTEAEWEYAARAGSTGVQYGPLDEVAWYGKNSGGQTHPVGGKQASAFGLYDMLGNVFEWVNDWYGENYYQNSPSEDPPGPESGQTRVVRGGAWNSSPRYVRVSLRIKHKPGSRAVTLGFRCGGAVFAP